MTARTAEPGTAVAKRTPEQQKLVNVNVRMARPAFIESLVKVLPKGITPERMILTALIAVERNKALQKCSDDSIADAVLQGATWGLELGREWHIVPYGDKATALIDWKGIISLSMRAKIIVSCTPRIVYATEAVSGDFRVEYGTNQHILHRPAWDSENAGPPVACYAVVRYPSGATDFELMSQRQIEEHRDRYSQSWKKDPQSPWKKEPLEMWKKTVIRRLHKRVPMPPLLAAAVEFDPDEARETVAEVMAAGREFQRGHRVPQVQAGELGYGGSEEPATSTQGNAATPWTSEQQAEIGRLFDAARARLAERAQICQHGVKPGEICAECEADLRDKIEEEVRRA